MPQYLISMYQPDGPIPPPEVLDPIMRDVAAVQEALEASGAWVFTGRLHPPHTATVVRQVDGELLTVDGPYPEGKEHLGGFVIISAADLDEALDWGGRFARATGLPIEVRPALDGGATGPGEGRP